MGGYTMNMLATETVVDMITADGIHAGNSSDDVVAIPALPAPQAGTSIGPDLAAFKSGWKEALGDIKAEMTGLAGKIKDGREVTIKVERQMGHHFDQFSR